jgi:hypothetical protein
MVILFLILAATKNSIAERLHYKLDNVDIHFKLGESLKMLPVANYKVVWGGWGMYRLCGSNWDYLVFILTRRHRCRL